METWHLFFPRKTKFAPYFCLVFGKYPIPIWNISTCSNEPCDKSWDISVWTDRQTLTHSRLGMKGKGSLDCCRDPAGDSRAKHIALVILCHFIGMVLLWFLWALSLRPRKASDLLSCVFLCLVAALWPSFVAVFLQKQMTSLALSI